MDFNPATICFSLQEFVLEVSFRRQLYLNLDRIMVSNTINNNLVVCLEALV